MDKHEPCSTCPWRKSSAVGGRDIPRFSIELMRRLRNTVGRGDAFRHVMACHHSKVGKEITCRGYVAVEGYHNLNVRMLAAAGKVNVLAIDEACKSIDLWPSFAEMLDAYETAYQEEGK